MMPGPNRRKETRQYQKKSQLAHTVAHRFPTDQSCQIFSNESEDFSFAASILSRSFAGRLRRARRACLHSSMYLYTVAPIKLPTIVVETETIVWTVPLMYHDAEVMTRKGIKITAQLTASHFRGDHEPQDMLVNYKCKKFLTVRFLSKLRKRVCSSVYKYCAVYSNDPPKRLCPIYISARDESSANSAFAMGLHAKGRYQRMGHSWQSYGNEYWMPLQPRRIRAVLVRTTPVRL